MTRGKKHKARVRARMEKTGESYTTARARLEPAVEAAEVREHGGAVWVNVPSLGLTEEVRTRLRASLVPPTELVAPVTQSCARLAAQLPGAAILCATATGVVLAAINVDAETRERLIDLGNPMKTPALMHAIDYLSAFSSGQLVAMRRMRPPKRLGLLMTTLYVLFSETHSLDLARMRIDHAALAIEAIFDGLVR